jgi:hypothetical protein
MFPAASLFIVTEVTLAFSHDFCEHLFSSQNYWVFGFGPSSSILKIRELSVSETGSASVLR